MKDWRTQTEVSSLEQLCPTLISTTIQMSFPYHKCNEPGVVVEDGGQIPYRRRSYLDVAKHEGGNEEEASHADERQHPTGRTGTGKLWKKE